MAAAPLRGLRVLDLSRVLAGPYASMILGDLGAEVIKIERPLVGDDTRHWGPPFKGDESVYFLSVNRNKKSVTVDFKQPRGATLLQRLAVKSDIAIENYLPGKLAKVGLDYATLKRLNPGIVYCSLTGFGQTGPWAGRAGYDLSVAAVGGLLHITGPADGPPCRVGVAVVDLTTGLYAALGVLAALHRRQATGAGSQVDANLLSSQMATLSMVGANWLTAGEEGRRRGTAHASIVPYQAFLAADGRWLLVGAGNDAQFAQLCAAVGRPGWAAEPQFASNAARVAHRESLVERLDARLRTRSRAEWLAAFEAAEVGFAFAPVNSVSEAFEEEQVRHNRLSLWLQHAAQGRVGVPGPALSFSDDGRRWAAGRESPDAPPVLGADTDDVLRHVLGMDSEEVAELRRDGVIGPRAA